MTFSKSQHAYFCCQSELHTLCPTVSSRAVFGTFMSCLTSSLRLGDPRPRKTLIKVPQSDHGMGPPLEPDKNFRMPNESVQAYCSNPFFITITFFVPYKRAGTHFSMHPAKRKKPEKLKNRNAWTRYLSGYTGFTAKSCLQFADCPFQLAFTP